MGKKYRFAIVLSGCGVKDGSEIHEAVMTMLAVVKSGGEYQCFAPDVKQAQVVNHVTGAQSGESRNCLVEAARIARGKIKPLAAFRADDYDALVFPGGFGAALNLCTFGASGPACTVNPDVAKAVKAMAQARKPIGALCIAPVILAKLLPQVKVTVGQDDDVNAALVKMGARVQNTTHAEVVVDETNRVVTTPCYMLDATIAQIADGSQNLVAAIIKLIETK